MNSKKKSISKAKQQQTPPHCFFQYNKNLQAVFVATEQYKHFKN